MIAAAERTSDLANFATDLIANIQKGIIGRIAYEQHNCNYLAWAIAHAGDGNHLEIGTLFGGTAILAALIKRRYHLDGMIYCIDPLDGYYTGTAYACATDPVSGWPVSREVLQENLAAFGVDKQVRIIQARSQPWPEELKSETFASAYIDGNHWGDIPVLDWMMVKQCTTRMVVFDNHDQKHPSVLNAGKIAKSDANWRVVLEQGISLVLERVS